MEKVRCSRRSSVIVTGPGGYADARNRLFATRRMPWRLMPFLVDAHARGALRQVGAVYEFRHIRLQERLADAHPRWTTRAGDLAERELQKHLPRIAPFSTTAAV